MQMVMARWRRFVDWFNGRELSEHAILLGFAVIIGVLAAGGVIAFYRAIDLSYAVFYTSTAKVMPSLGELFYRPLVTGAGLFVAWLIMRHLGRGFDGLNVPDVQLAVVKRGGVVPGRPAIARTLASAVTIGSGASAGSEGPVVVLGAAIGSALGRAFQFTPERVRVFVACACGAAISAAFNAPLAGAFFALEEILGSLGVASFSPVVVASVVAAVVSRAAFGNHPAFPIPSQYGYGSALEVIVFFPLLGIVTGLAAVGFVRTYFGADTAFRWLRSKVPAPVVPWIAGIIVGVLVWLSGGLLVGYGHLAIHVEMFGELPWYTLLALGAGGIVATSITLNGGGSGGVFTPSLYVGAATGGGVGVLLARLFPGLGLHPEAYAVVGMGAMIAGATDAPITGILLVFEMTNDYAIVLPLMLTVVVAHFVARRLEPDSLYSGWLRRRGESVEHSVEALSVRDAYDPSPAVIDENAPITDAVAYLNNRSQSVFPVVDAERHVMGVVTIGDLGRCAATAGILGSLVLAADIAQETETVGPGDTLLSAMRRMGVRGAAAIPVVQDGRLIGIISRAHILSAYERYA
jgi:chloride channel protein, CIC family